MAQPRTIGRYVLFDEIGHGGMATVHLGRLLGGSGFSRTVAIKRLHPYCARDPQFTASFLDEAHLSGRIQHPNVAAMLDVVSMDDELLLVMEYVHGQPLSQLLALAREAGRHVAPSIAVAVIIDVLRGLHAAHEAKSEMGEPLAIVHRDVTPQNILVGADGVSRLVDFGVAKAATRLQTTAEGTVKGKIAYMPPEQLEGRPIDRRVDVYAASVVLWETLATRRLFAGDNPGNVVTRVLEMPVDLPSVYAPDVSRALDEVVMRGLERVVAKRFATAEDMAHALEQALPPATAREVSEWVRATASQQLAERAELVSSVERAPVPAAGAPPDPSPRPVTADPLTHSQISNISVSLGAPSARPARRMALVATTAALVAGVGVALTQSFWRRPPVAERPIPTAFTSASAPATVTAPPAAPPATTASAPATVSTPSETPRPRRTAPPHVTHPLAGARKPDCNPPYTLDPTDPRIHVAKPECL